MTIAHHPSEIVLAEFANCRLDEASALVVGSHIAHCPACQQAVRRCEVVGGAMLQEATSEGPLQIDADALLARIDAESPGVEQPKASVTAPSTNPGEVLAHYECGEWRWIGPGIHWRKVAVPSEQGIRVFMLRAKGGTSLPHHKHSGIEWTQVLEGAFVHTHGRFGPGDFDEADPTVEHDPVVEKGCDCICLVAMTGKLELQGLLGRLVQPFVRL